MISRVGDEPETVDADTGATRWSIALWAFAIAAALVAAYLAVRGTELGRDASGSPGRRPWGALPLVGLLLLAAGVWLLRFAPRRWHVVAGLALAAASFVTAAVIGFTAPRPPSAPLASLSVLGVLALILLALAGIGYAVSATRAGTRTGRKPAIAGAVALAVLAPLAVAVFAVPAASGVVDRANVVSSATDAPVGVLRTRLAGTAWAHTYPGSYSGDTQVVATDAGFGVELPGGVGVADRATGDLRWTYRVLDADREGPTGPPIDGIAVTSADGQDLAVTLTRHGVDHVAVLDAASGRVRADVVPPAYRDTYDDNRSKSSTLVALDEHALYFDGGDTLTAVRRDGSVRWRADEPRGVAHAVSTPAGLVTVVPGGAANRGEPALVMRDTRTGQVRWHYGRAGATDQPNVQLALHGGQLLVAQPKAKQLAALRLRDGHVAWHRSQPADEIEVSPDGRTLLTVAGRPGPKDRVGLMLRGLDAATGRQRWRTTLDAVDRDTSAAYRPRVRANGYSSPNLAAVRSGTFLLGYRAPGDRTRLAAVRPDHGEVRQLPLPDRCDRTTNWPRLLTSGATAAVVCVPPLGTPSLLVTGLR